MAKRKLQFYIDSETYEILKRLKEEQRYPFAETIRLALALLFTGDSPEAVEVIRKALNA